MTTEIERKFIVDAVPPIEPSSGIASSGVDSSGTVIRQGYLADQNGVEVRIRITASRSSITVKAGHGLSRTEVDVELDPRDAESLWPFTAGRQILKTRHRLEVDGGVAEVDIYAGALTGLMTVEVEFESEGAAAAFVMPDWFGREVTGDPAWSNAALASSGRPER